MKPSAPLTRKVPLRPGTKRMKQGRSTGKPTKAQQERLEAIKDIGCIVARILGLGFVPCEIHHLTVGGRHGQKRRGHDATVGLNPWSHRGAWYLIADSSLGAERAFGVSYAHSPRAFREKYPDELLLSETEKALAEWRRGTLGAAA